jgi:tRNA threonylcarbamoyladenosine biosynthesis protein TsaE
MAVVRHLPIVKNLVCPNEDATATLAQTLARAAGIADAFIALHGDLGAGKTTLVRHLLRALGVEGRIKSPTYAVVEPHEATLHGQPLAVWHFDFYRFSDPREWEDAGFRDIFAGPGLKLAEWPQQAAAYLPAADLDVRLEVHDEQRHISLTANTALGANILEALAG